MSTTRLVLLASGLAIAATFLIFLQSATTPTPEDLSLPRFRSFFMDPLFVDDAFKSVATISPDPTVRIALVNHHLLAPHLIARTLASAATTEPITVVLISPDHFTRGAAPITSVIGNWPTPFGVIQPAVAEIAQLASAGVVHLQEKPFAFEHGITNVTMFIARALPRARLVPIIVRDDTRDHAIDALAETLVALTGRVLFVGSFDFTHDSDESVAEKNDALSAQILLSGDITRASLIHTDSIPGVRLLLRIAQLEQLHFKLLERSNSAQILNDMTRTDVTSYITGVWSE